MDGEGGNGSGGSGMGIGRLGFSVEEVRRGGRERTVGVTPGTRRTTSFCMRWGFWKEVSTKGGFLGVGKADCSPVL
jgi:hypothetical protein